MHRRVDLNPRVKFFKMTGTRGAGLSLGQGGHWAASGGAFWQKQGHCMFGAGVPALLHQHALSVSSACVFGHSVPPLAAWGWGGGQPIQHGVVRHLALRPGLGDISDVQRADGRRFACRRSHADDLHAGVTRHLACCLCVMGFRGNLISVFINSSTPHPACRGPRHPGGVTFGSACVQTMSSG